MYNGDKDFVRFLLRPTHKDQMSLIRWEFVNYIFVLLSDDITNLLEDWDTCSLAATDLAHVGGVVHRLWTTTEMLAATKYIKKIKYMKLKGLGLTLRMHLSW